MVPTETYRPLKGMDFSLCTHRESKSAWKQRIDSGSWLAWIWRGAHRKPSWWLSRTESGHRWQLEMKYTGFSSKPQQPNLVKTWMILKDDLLSVYPNEKSFSLTTPFWHCEIWAGNRTEESYRTLPKDMDTFSFTVFGNWHTATEN